MADFDNRLVRGTASVADGVDAGLRAHMLRVYNYMVGALALTGVVAYLVANTPALLNSFYHEVMTTNGVALSPDGLSLYLATTGGGPIPMMINPTAITPSPKL